MMSLLSAVFAPLTLLRPAVRTLHAPDGFFSLPVIAATWAISVPAIYVALQRAGRSLTERTVPILGVMAAFIFAAQMLNFPVAGGTSGHLIGAALAAIVLGPWAAVVVMTAVVALQAIVFQDGGLVVMGANLLNLAVIPVFTAWIVFSLGRRAAVSRGKLLVLSGICAWVSVEAGALATAIELGLSGTSPLIIVVPGMLGAHALIGLGEALITAGAMAVIYNAKRELLMNRGLVFTAAPK